MAININPGSPLRLLSVIGSSGNWTAPANTNVAFISLHGASGGGGNMGRYQSAPSGTAGGNGIIAGAWVQVTPSATHAVVIGAAGAAGAAINSPGINVGATGGNTSFDGNSFVAYGGSGGNRYGTSAGSTAGATSLSTLPPSNLAIPKTSAIVSQLTGGTTGGSSAGTSTPRYGNANGAGAGQAGSAYIYT
jgi:hypothetical protein